jgi:hypothetical protein
MATLPVTAITTATRSQSNKLGGGGLTLIPPFYRESPRWQNEAVRRSWGIGGRGSRRTANVRVASDDSSELTVARAHSPSIVPAYRGRAV